MQPFSVGKCLNYSTTGRIKDEVDPEVTYCCALFNHKVVVSKEAGKEAQTCHLLHRKPMYIHVSGFENKNIGSNMLDNILEG